MFSDSGISATLFTLAVFLMGVIQATMAMPTAQVTALVLVITSDIEPGIPYDGVMGPFIIGKNLTITCSTETSQALSWWEGDKQLPTFNEVENGVISCNFIVGTLQTEDSHRHFTCRELVSGTEKSVDLHLTDDTMEIQRDGHPLKNEETVKVFTGTNSSLDCVVNGSNPSAGSWWEGETKLAAKRTKSPHGITSQLALRSAKIEDDGRKLTCRARNGQLTKTVVLNVVEAMTGARPTTKPPAMATSIPLPATTNEVNIYLIAGGAFIAVIGVVVIILIFVIVMMGKKVFKQERSTSQELMDSPEDRSDTSTVETPVTNSLTSLDPLLIRPPRLEGGDETASSGKRMSAMGPNDRDHSYYYPNLINNSYYYPKITDDVKVT